jgi:hypothetical protein
MTLFVRRSLLVGLRRVGGQGEMAPSIQQLAEALTGVFPQPLVMHSEPSTRAAVLGWVNHARRAIDLPPH